MKIKLSIWILAIGFVLEFIGAGLKITHQAAADITLTVAAIFKVIGILLFVIFFLGHPKIKEFLAYDKFTDSFE